MWVFNERHDFGVETDPTQGEFFVNNEIDRNSSLIRETIQNSLDARRDDAPCVEVRFTFHDGALFLDAPTLRQYVDGLVPHLAACGVDVAAIGLDNPRFLLVEDFGTHGLRGDPESQTPSDFYFFWHVVGRSGKGDVKAGRWGLGKTVFPNSSQVSAFLGYTVRGDDRRRLLLGQTCLRTHEREGATYLPYAFYQRSGPRQFELPFEEPTVLDRFRDDFRLSRRDEPGLSVAIPYPYAELTETALVEAAIEHYFFAILAGRLVVRVNEQVIHAQSILGIAERLQSRRLKDIEKALAFAFEIQHLPADAVVSADEPDRLNSESGRVPPDAFDPEHLRRLRDAFRDQKIVALRLPVTIEPRNAPVQTSFVTIYLKRDPMLLRGHDYYLRSGITLTGQSVFSGRPALGILLADDPPVCRFLGDAENPAHTLWNPRSQRLAGKYHRARETVMFLREAMASLLDTLTQSDAEEDRHALSQIFFTPRKQEREEKQRQTQPAPTPDLVAVGQQAPLLIAPIQGGFRLKAGPGLSPGRLPLRISTRVSYEIRRGNGFKKYSPQDFRLDREPIVVAAQGVSGLRAAANTLEFAVTDLAFDVEVRGFDVHRDLAVRVVEKDDGEP
jgi:hypothetical protein